MKLYFSPASPFARKCRIVARELDIRLVETVSIVRQSENAYGDHTPGLDHDVTGCAIWPTTGTETVAGGMDVVVFGLTVLMPPGTDVLSTDTVLARGVTYMVNGEPTLYQSPLTGTQSGIEVQLKTETG